MKAHGIILVISFGLAVFAKQVPQPEHTPHVVGKIGTLPDPDGNLHVYSLPVGQGDSHVIQCPSGTLTLFDMGSSDYDVDEPDPDSRYVTTDDIREFFGDSQDLIRNIFFTHNHYDHYILATRAFSEQGVDLVGLENIYISCTGDDLASFVAQWVDDMDFRGLLRPFNGGSPCGPINGTQCDAVNICPDDPDVTSVIMAANLGGHCSDDGNRNMDSVFLRLEFGGTKVTMTGDFEDETSDWFEDGLQKLMVDYYGDELATTTFILSHHGASFLANKPVFQAGLRPKAVSSSANPSYSYHHPRCAVFDRLIELDESLCEPNADPGSSTYCGDDYDQSVPADQRVQETYTCGLAGGDETCPEQMCLRNNNTFALYTTVPDENDIQLVHLRVTPGGLWAFTTDLISSPRRNHFSPV